jgi:hypothetical protein
MVLGDQYKADDGAGQLGGPVFFKNNLWLSKSAWPNESSIQDVAPRLGDPRFKRPGGPNLEDYVPANVALIKEKGIVIEPIAGDFLGLLQGMNPQKDIMGYPLGSRPPIGAIAPK